MLGESQDQYDEGRRMKLIFSFSFSTESAFCNLNVNAAYGRP